MVAACRQFRQWALGHQGEFALIFGSPLPGLDDGRGDMADECGRQFAGVYFAAGLIAFELAEVAWIGFQPLEAVFAAVGAAVDALHQQGAAQVSGKGATKEATATRAAARAALLQTLETISQTARALALG